ncbi:MAG: hypothetical protein IAE80_10115 [Anaerolinea sp.]|nr:hypothetical protein [Anaerolinea sp.]
MFIVPRIFTFATRCVRQRFFGENAELLVERGLEFSRREQEAACGTF